jgi:hypothetical protein
MTRVIESNSTPMKFYIAQPMVTLPAFTLLTFTLLVGCAKSDNSAFSHGSNDISKQHKNGQVCYPGLNNVPACFKLTPLDSSIEQSPLYRYLDPEEDPSFPEEFDGAQYRAPTRAIDLRQSRGSQELTEHFTRAELMLGNDQRGQYGIFSPAAAAQLEKVRMEADEAITVSSGYRSPGQNGVIGGAQWSRHTFGDGVDLVVESAEYEKLGKTCLKHGANFCQVYTDHVHCDWRELPLDGAFFAKPNPPQPSPLSSLTYRIEQASRITVSAKRRGAWGRAQTLVLGVETWVEDDGTPTYQWEIEDDKGTIQRSRGPTVEIRGKKGVYRATATAGECLSVTRQLQIE